MTPRGQWWLGVGLGFWRDGWAWGGGGLVGFVGEGLRMGWFEMGRVQGTTPRGEAEGGEGARARSMALLGGAGDRSMAFLGGAGARGTAPLGGLGLGA
ncbi:hypothetical protein KY285_035629 [Solanum tuberosum]|nr:hypothetical protein KY285_035629 [Solanum tuberosum]